MLCLVNSHRIAGSDLGDFFFWPGRGVPVHKTHSIIKYGL